MGSDNITTATAAANNAFQSTLPGWGATGRILGHGFPVGISIHAPRMGSDLTPVGVDIGGGRFQSTLPGWGATIVPAQWREMVFISIHAPRMGSDPQSATNAPSRYISIHAPRMGSDFSWRGLPPTVDISIHAPRMGSDDASPTLTRHMTYFNPRSPDGERPRKWTSSPTIWAKSSIFNTDCIADRR